MTEFVEVPGVRLIHGDCLDVMPTLEAGSIDLILSDLPYGVTACKWDTVIPFGPLWECFRHVLKPRGAVVLTACQPFTSMLVMSNREWFRYAMVWEKANGVDFLNAPFKPMQNHEDILVFSPAASTFSRRGCMTFHPQREPGEPWKRGGTDCGRSKAGRMPFHTAPREGERNRESKEPGRHPRSVVKFRAVNESQSDRWGHPTQKPVALFEYLIKTYSNEGETVLDATIGSGTTAVACLNTGRRCVGIERDPGYFDVARRRVQEAAAATPLFA